MKPKDFHSIVNFIYETGILSKTPRSGLWFLGTGKQSVAEHLLHTTYIGYVLAKLTPHANIDRVIFLCLMHDLGEGRTSDLNYVHQKYGRLAESQAIADLAATLPFGEEILDAYKEEQARTTLEARIAKDADSLDWMVTLREEFSKGNTKANTWSKLALKRMKTPAAKKIGKLLMEIHPDDWWFDRRDEWYVTRKPEHKRWKGR